MAKKDFALDYIDVAERIVEFRTKHPEGSLQQVSLDFREFGGKSWVVFTAAAYRNEDDQRPGHGTAWEPVPGATPFTRDSELQNAETAAWGRAIVAVLAADTKRGVSSAEEVRNRQEPVAAAPEPTPEQLAAQVAQGIQDSTTEAEVREWGNRAHAKGLLTPELTELVTARLTELQVAS